jgi:predicted dithiol-disulfide oxidoreductase (DUF899 family)
VAKKSPVTFPGETARYRTARNRLLTAERGLRKRVEQVARMRRKLPLGGPVPEDYVFDEGPHVLADGTTVRQTKLSELFGDKDTLVIYSFMYGENMAQACTMCAAFLDSLDGAARHAVQRAALAVVAGSGIDRIREFAQQRGWRQLRLLSAASTNYNRDYHGENQSGGQLPALNVFVKRKGKLYHFYNTEMLYGTAERGQNQRHNDMVWPLWNLLDLTPEGRGSDWHPRLSY